MTDYSRHSAIELVAALLELLKLVPEKVHFVGGEEEEITRVVAALRRECQNGPRASFVIIYALTATLFDFNHPMHLWPRHVSVEGDDAPRFRRESTEVWTRMQQLVEAKAFGCEDA